MKAKTKTKKTVKKGAKKVSPRQKSKMHKPEQLPLGKDWR